MNTVIAIDGPAGSGKSTVSRLLASKINFLYLDTGAMYRAVALWAMRKGIDLGDGKKLGDMCRAMDFRFDTQEDPPRLLMDNEDISAAIRSQEMDIAASSVSAVKEVREAMADLQRKIAKGENIVAEGRDIGTVIFPFAELKFFLTASDEERAERRYRERLMRGENVSRASVSKELKKRDHQDETRVLAPLKPAEDAVLIDSTGLSIEQVLEQILGHVKGKVIGIS